MSEQIIFTFRVIGAFTAFFVATMLAHESLIRATGKRFDMAFRLSASCGGVALGAFAALTWNTAYMVLRYLGYPIEWMLESPVVVAYTLVLMVSAVALMYTLSVTRVRAAWCIGVTILGGITAYLWVGQYV